MIEPLCRDSKFDTTLDALAKIDRELIAARETIAAQVEEIERLRSKAAAALRVQNEAMSQVEKAIAAIGEARSRAAQTEAALDEERAERMRLAHELSVVSEQVGLLFDTLPAAS